MEKNIIFVEKKNFFFSKLSILLEKDGFIFEKLSNKKKILETNVNKAFFFFFYESKESIIQLKKIKLQNLNLIIFINQSTEIVERFPSAIYMKLPLIYNELIRELKRIVKISKINKNHCKIGEFLFNHKTSELIKEDSSLKINLTELENRFLNYMIKRHKGATKSQILSEVWKHNKQLDTHTLESLIYRLRKKIEKNPNKPSILINDTKKYFLINAK